jgi:hypothetical protein
VGPIDHGRGRHQFRPVRGPFGDRGSVCRLVTCVSWPRASSRFAATISPLARAGIAPTVEQPPAPTTRNAATNPAKNTGSGAVRSASDTDNRLTTMLELTYTELVVAALEVFDLWALSNEPALLIGMDCLRRFSRLHRLRTQGAVLRCGEGTDPTATRSRAATAPRRLKRPIQLAVETMQHSGCCIGDIGATIHWAAAAGRSLVGRTAQYLQCRALRLSAGSSRPTSAPDRGFSPS